jgi:hemoglobin-like flavoprotein
MDRADWRLVRESMDDFDTCGPALIAMAVRSLGDNHPEVRALLPRDTSIYHARWYATLRQIVTHAGQFGRLTDPLARLGAQANAAGARPNHYRAVRDELLRAMADLAGDVWTERTRRAWTELLDAAIGAMLAGASARRAA